TATLGANSAKTDGNGKATVTLKSGTPGQVVVSAKTAEMTSPLNASAVIFVDQTKASITEIKADKTTAKANGSDAITYIVKVMKNNQPEANHSVTFSTNFGNLGGNSNTQIVKTDKDGRATVKLTSGVAGNAV
ncbi:Ig-like domain-containing protein, partial [Escherichia coli]